MTTNFQIQFVVIWYQYGMGGPRHDKGSSFGKIVVENRCYLPGVYSFGEEAEIRNIYYKMGKSIFHSDF